MVPYTTRITFGTAMNRSVIALLASCLILSVHFSFCLWSAITESSSPQLNVHRYTRPLFVQPWQVCGSDFHTSVLNLEFRKHDGMQWLDWKDATDSISSGASSPMVRIEEDIHDDLRWEVAHNLYSVNGRPRFDRILQSSAYARAIFYVARMEQLSGAFSTDSLQIRLAIRFIPTTDQAYSQQISYLNFPAFSLP
jgi:hypothetical protein